VDTSQGKGTRSRLGANSFPGFHSPARRPTPDPIPSDASVDARTCQDMASRASIPPLTPSRSANLHRNSITMQQVATNVCMYIHTVSEARAGRWCCSRCVVGDGCHEHARRRACMQMLARPPTTTNPPHCQGWADLTMAPSTPTPTGLAPCAQPTPRVPPAWRNLETPAIPCPRSSCQAPSSAERVDSGGFHHVHQSVVLDRPRGWWMLCDDLPCPVDARR
jgi:hypothetical protein